MSKESTNNNDIFDEFEEEETMENTKKTEGTTTVGVKLKKEGLFKRIGKGIGKAGRGVMNFVRKHPAVASVITTSIGAGLGVGGTKLVEEVLKRRNHPAEIETTFSDAETTDGGQDDIFEE